jgi:capsular exopolysaccharide synthesis family protein
MQQITPGAPDEGSEQLPARSDGRRAALTIARSNQQLSLDLRQNPESGESDEGINLFDYWRILVKRRWTVVATLAMVLVIAMVNTLLTTPIYRATTIIQVTPMSPRNMQVGGATANLEYDYQNDFQQTQIELLKSRSIAQRAVSQMGLLDSGEMDHLWPSTAWEKLKSQFSGGTDQTDATQPKLKPAADKKSGDQRVEGLAHSFLGGLSVEGVKDSQLVRINYDSPSPSFSQRAANATAEVFIAANLERRFDSSSYAKTYLEDRLQELKLKLEDSERKLVDFAQKEQIVSSGDTSGMGLLEQNLNSMNTAYSTAKQNRIRAEARWKQAQTLSGSGLWQLAPVQGGSGNGGSADNPMIKNLQESRSHMLVDYQDKLRLYKPDYPQMQQLKGQIDEIDHQIKTEEGNIRAGVRADYEAALQEETVLGAQLEGMRSDVLDLQKRSIQYNVYKREVDTNRQLYDALLQRYKELDIAGGVTANNIALIDRAEPGFKLLPNLRHDFIQALLSGLMLGVLLAFAFEYIDDTIKRPDDLEKLLGISVLGAIPLLKPPMTPARALQDERSGFSEAYRSLRTALQFSTDHGVPRTLLITSATASEGKSTTALVLGQFFAQLGKRVLIVDCDLRNPSLHKSFNVDNSQGLSNYLAGAGRPDLIKQTTIPGLSYLPTGPLPPNPAELLMGSKMMSVLTVAAEKFDLLILDGPPVLGLADAPVLSNLAQGTLLIVRAEETRIAVIKNAIKRLQVARAHIVGGLLTHFQPEHGGQGYAYGASSYYYAAASGRPQLTRK